MTKIKGFLLGLLLLITGVVFGQGGADTIPSIEFQRQIFIYQLAKKYNDATMVKTALYNILSIYPSNTNILDSLALMYFDYQQYASAALVSADIVKMYPDDLLATEIAAISFEQLGVKDRALKYYEKLYLGNNSLALLYQISFMQYSLKRITEAEVNLDLLTGNAESENFTLIFPTTANDSQDVSLRAAAFRLRALIESEKGNKQAAKDLLKKALEIQPDFQVAKTELAKLN
ncbi:MAG: hypothetical protein OEY56_07620 [Cyclobacteriaceae bacterium]|nr:hypothetical protein [Cyclobacteriaceae bacterium]